LIKLDRVARHHRLVGICAWKESLVQWILAQMMLTATLMVLSATIFKPWAAENASGSNLHLREQTGEAGITKCKRSLFLHRCKMARALHMNNACVREGGNTNLPGGALILAREDDCL
jgi:hypothetical protein